MKASYPHLAIAEVILLSLLASGCASSPDIHLFGKRTEAQVIQDTLNLGRLAPLPDNLRWKSLIEIEETFTSGAKGSFYSTPAAIKNWIKNSPGATEGKLTIQPDSSHYYVLLSNWGDCGFLKIDPDFMKVEFDIEFTE